MKKPNPKRNLLIKGLLLFLIVLSLVIFYLWVISDNEYLLKSVIHEKSKIAQEIESNGSKIKISQVKDFEQILSSKKYGVFAPVITAIREVKKSQLELGNYILFDNVVYVIDFDESFIEGPLELYTENLVEEYYGQYRLNKNPIVKVIDQEKYETIKKDQKQSIADFYQYFIDLRKDRRKMYEEFLVENLKELENGNPFFQPFVDQDNAEIAKLNDQISKIEESRNLALQNFDKRAPSIGLSIGDTIYILKSPNMSQSKLMSVMIHEHLHFSSEKDDYFLSPFFEEGLTDIFTSRIIENSNLYEGSALSSYPYNTELIKTMHKDIDEEQFEKIYFNKDSAELKTLLNKLYGIDFDDKYSSSFTEITYLENPSQTAIDHYNEVFGIIEGN